MRWIVGVAGGITAAGCALLQDWSTVGAVCFVCWASIWWKPLWTRSKSYG